MTVTFFLVNLFYENLVWFPTSVLIFNIFWGVSFIFTTIFKHAMIFVDMGIIGDIDIIDVW